MKKIVCIVALVLVHFGYSQELSKVLLDEDYVIDFIGVDYSEVKLFGTSEDFRNAQNIRDEYFTIWNKFFYNEPAKFNMAEALRKKKVNYMIEVVELVNSSADTGNMIVSTKPEPFSLEKIQEMVRRYRFEPGSEVAMVIIVNNLNKMDTEAIADVVFFNTNSGTILYNEKMMGDPAGFGFRNYWVNSIYDIMEKLRKKQYKKWKKQFN